MESSSSTESQSSTVSQDSLRTVTMEERLRKERLMSRGSMLLAVTPGSCLARRIMYSRSSKPHVTQPQVKYHSRRTDVRDAINQTHFLPRVVNPKSSFAKRYDYSVDTKGSADALSSTMRDYATNKSMINTWLQRRFVKKVEKKVNEQQKNNPAEPCSCLTAEKQDSDSKAKNSSLNSKAQPLNSSDKRDALLPVTRKYFHRVSHTQTWEKERISKEVIARIDKKFKELLIPTSALHPSKQFMDEAYSWMKSFNVSQEELYSMVEQHWVAPRYSRYRREITESLLLSEYHIHS